jgi:hypothetical protein
LTNIDGSVSSKKIWIIIFLAQKIGKEKQCPLSIVPYSIIHQYRNDEGASKKWRSQILVTNE